MNDEQDSMAYAAFVRHASNGTMGAYAFRRAVGDLLAQGIATAKPLPPAPKPLSAADAAQNYGQAQQNKV